jgi:hypothetical protein
MGMELDPQTEIRELRAALMREHADNARLKRDVRALEMRARALELSRDVALRLAAMMGGPGRQKPAGARTSERQG